jgi:hypothetical protein
VVASISRDESASAWMDDLDETDEPGDAPVPCPRQPHSKGLAERTAAPLPESDFTM